MLQHIDLGVAGLAWAVLYGTFGWGVWLSARSNRALRVAGPVTIIAAIAGLFWPPMHRREVLAAGGETLTDTMHLVWTAANGVRTLLVMGLGAAAFGGRFRLYSIVASPKVAGTPGRLTPRSMPDRWLSPLR